MRGNVPSRAIIPPAPRATCRAFCNGGIARHDMILWNNAPWIVHEPGARDSRDTRWAGSIAALLDLLLKLLVVVLAGLVARAAALIVTRDDRCLRVLTMPHPSPTITCISPAVAASICSKLAAITADALNRINRVDPWGKCVKPLRRVPFTYARVRP